ncbi:MAG: hypothetical protein HY906_08475 [Deltaproteobacteria bacterium]|nr:hypothetical protein [Deltaproteobacteria bacterium]
MQTHWQRAWVVLACVGLPLVAACGGESVNNPDPRLIAGGGAGDGAIKGALHVYVIDGMSGAPITGAAVRVGDSADTAPLTGTTDSAGLASFKDGQLKGPQTVTATAATYAASTWVGANAANLTIPLESTQSPQPATAKAEGTIQGWDTRPAPAAGHLLLAYIGYSYVEPFDAPENTIPQGTQDFFGVTLPTNLCAKAVIGGTERKACNWKLNTRTGKQIHWAVVIDLDTKNTTDRNDDTITVVDYAFLLDQNLAANENKTGEVLVPVGSAGMTSATVALQTAPTGMTAVVGLPLIKMGDSGDIALAFTPFGSSTLTQPVPALTGVLASATYDFIAHAKADANTAFPQSTIWKRGVALGSTVDFGAWLPQPTSFSTTGGTYSFAPAAEASLHTVKFLQEGTSGATVAWNVGLLDGSTSFTLPALSPSPLPTGQLNLRVEALTVPSFDAEEFEIDTLRDAATRHSAGQLTFTR